MTRAMMYTSASSAGSRSGSGGGSHRDPWEFGRVRLRVAGQSRVPVCILFTTYFPHPVYRRRVLPNPLITTSSLRSPNLTDRPTSTFDSPESSATATALFIFHLFHSNFISNRTRPLYDVWSDNIIIILQ